jgi:hypothetical protein
MSLLSVSELENHLSLAVARIEFTKVDGSARTMICTKSVGIIGESQMPRGDSKKALDNANLLKVYDLEKRSWRSMRIANIISWLPAEFSLDNIS